MKTVGLFLKTKLINANYHKRNLWMRFLSAEFSVNSFSSGFKEVTFDVYQRASEKPVLRIAKNLRPSYLNEKYLIKDKK